MQRLVRDHTRYRQRRPLLPAELVPIIDASQQRMGASSQIDLPRNYPLTTASTLRDAGAGPNWPSRQRSAILQYPPADRPTSTMAMPEVVVSGTDLAREVVLPSVDLASTRTPIEPFRGVALRHTSSVLALRAQAFSPCHLSQAAAPFLSISTCSSSAMTHCRRITAGRRGKIIPRPALLLAAALLLSFTRAAAQLSKQFGHTRDGCGSHEPSPSIARAGRLREN